ncbi:MAG TPA: hypothetical protein VF002_01200 [Gaiellaceae bacterium]
MSTTPPEEGRGPTMPMGQTFASTGSIVRLPVPGNAEFVVYVVIEVIFTIVWASTAVVNAYGWMIWTAVLTSAYLLSRGIAKASRVLEA